MTENDPIVTSVHGVRMKEVSDDLSRTTCRQKRFSARRIVVFAILMLVAGRIYADREFWQSAWRESTPWSRSTASNLISDSAPLVAIQARSQDPFDLSRTTIPSSEIFAGGPPRDGIPALTNPRFIDARKVDYLRDDDRVVGIAFDGESRAYPLKILNYHEIVNDRMGSRDFAVTYCPLCDSSVVFDRRTKHGVKEFGVSGLLYNSNVLMYDRSGQSESLWSQMMAEGISGPGSRISLKTLPLDLATWKEWRSRHPKTKVLSTKTGHARNYSRSPYENYFTTPRLMFDVKPKSNRLPTKARVLGVWTDKMSRAYPESAFDRDHTRIEDALGGKRIVIEFNPETKSLRVAKAADGVQWAYSFWFAWYAMRSDTDVFEP